MVVYLCLYIFLRKYYRSYGEIYLEMFADITPLSILGFSQISIYKGSAVAQVTSNDTVNAEINQNGNTAEITGGETRGTDLFHSFQDFSIQTGNEAFFDNANDISNIFSRVTGENISNIDGAIRANSSSNLFLINPAGIVFGEGARLNMGGSFYGSTASSILSATKKLFKFAFFRIEERTRLQMIPY